MQQHTAQQTMGDREMSERKLLAEWKEARAAYDARPCWKTACDCMLVAESLCNISDDYAEYMDEARDLLDEHYDTALLSNKLAE